MAMDWESVTKIGSKVRGPGTAQRETTIKGKSALNAAQRSGAIVGTEKKFGTANASNSGLEGQRLTKVDAADGPVATKKVPDEVAKALSTARTKLKNQKGNTMTQKDLAAKANVDVAAVAALERTGADFPAMDVVLKLQKAAGVRLTGSNIGESTLGPKKKDKTDSNKKKAGPAAGAREKNAGDNSKTGREVATGLSEEAEKEKELANATENLKSEEAEKEKDLANATENLESEEAEKEKELADATGNLNVT